MRNAPYTKLAQVFALIIFAVTAAPATAQLPADARFAYEWNLNGTALGSSLNVVTGSTVTLQVYLIQTQGATQVLTAEGGLFSGGTRTTYGTTGVLSVATVNDIVPNPRFSNTDFLVRNTTTNFAEFIASAPFAGPAATPDATGRVLLGSFTYQVPGAAGSSTTLTADLVPNGTQVEIITWTNGFQLDPVTSPDVITINVVPVPEPASVLGVAAGVAALGAFVRRRFRKAPAS